MKGEIKTILIWKTNLIYPFWNSNFGKSRERDGNFIHSPIVFGICGLLTHSPNMCLCVQSAFFSHTVWGAQLDNFDRGGGGRWCIFNMKDKIKHGLSTNVKCFAPLIFRDMALDKVWNAGGGAPGCAPALSALKRRPGLKGKKKYGAFVSVFGLETKKKS